MGATTLPYSLPGFHSAWPTKLTPKSHHSVHNTCGDQNSDGSDMLQDPHLQAAMYCLLSWALPKLLTDARLSTPGFTHLVVHLLPEKGP